jgi:hypothetical protein
MIAFRNHVLVMLLISVAVTQTVTAQTANDSLNKVYQDETHCLTAADMRGDQDKSISCYCRDAIIDWRYVYFTYVLSGKDSNLNGALLTLEQHVREQCGEKCQALLQAAEHESWSWDGPEVVRTYPPDDLMSRITPETRNGKPYGGWVPFTVQLIYRDSRGNITKTEDYSSREFFPITKQTTEL